MDAARKLGVEEAFGTVPPPQAYWLAKRAGSVRDVVPSTYGSGIGAAFASELARRGGKVVCSDIDETAARRTADAISDRGAEALAVRCDVTQIDDVRALADQAQEWFGTPPTLVINNAGIGAGGAMGLDTLGAAASRSGSVRARGREPTSRITSSAPAK